MKKVFTTLMALAVGISAMAQGGISDEALKKIKEGYKGTPEEIALRNAISRNDINKLAVNLDSQANIDTYFSHKVPSKGITDQESSGRCWLFTGMNVLRAEMIKKYN